MRPDREDGGSIRIHRATACGGILTQPDNHVNYFGSADSELIAKDFSREDRRDFTIRKEILWETVSLQYNNLTTIDISQIPHVSNVWLRGNPLEEIIVWWNTDSPPPTTLQYDGNPVIRNP